MTESAQLLLDSFFLGDRDNMNDEDTVTLKWILKHLILGGMGSRWNVVGRVNEKEQSKRSFSNNISASDISFVYIY